MCRCTAQDQAPHIPVQVDDHLTIFHAPACAVMGHAGAVRSEAFRDLDDLAARVNDVIRLNRGQGDRMTPYQRKRGCRQASQCHAIVQAHHVKHPWRAITGGTGAARNTYHDGKRGQPALAKANHSIRPISR